MKKLKYKSFDEWWEEFVGIQNIDPQQPETRGERLMEEYGSSIKDEARQIWALGWICAENTADGHTAEAAKDVRDAGWPEAAEVIESKSIPEGRKIIDSNIEAMARQAALIGDER